MRVKKVKVEFQLFKDNQIHQKFNKTFEFFEHSNIKKDLEEECRGYEGHEKKTFTCKYKILSESEGEI